ncbi:MAG: sugar isomerase [Elusimicrobia bacterium CG1_02_37_114]|nr:MAG: sugar isomerase [Elusimicrobia bacterium CG1_02_37_114]PIV53685.1 MAG: sugar isomerase [Elusimicrobia bacterium CG02_land_8_20_14_3_00_37_13]PIZ12732.1 MAG: sugar isomerase [Elusimicrobia bacterium CG_4_10_14_0_8_um_filter_37_32]
MSTRQITKDNLKKLEEEYSGYLEGEKLDKFFEDFDIKFAAGHWAAGGFADRFAPDGYNPGMDSGIIKQIERVAQSGIKGIEFHEALFIDKNYKKDDTKINAVKEALKEHNLIPTNMNTNLFSDSKWKLGGITNANKTIRDSALAVALQGVDIAKELGCSSVALWPGSDGWDYNFEVNYGVIIDRFIEGCIAINKKAKSSGLKFGTEAKLHEPREGNMVCPTTHMAILVSKIVNEECGATNMGVAIDYGHEQMYAVEPASMLYMAKRAGVPVVNFHVNNAKLHSNDEDRIAGTGDIWRLADFCYAAIDTGYDGWFGEDQFTYRTDPVKSMAMSREFFANVMKKSLRIYAVRDKLEKAQSKGDACEALEVVKKIIL